MQRRGFIELAAGALAAGAVTGRIPRMGTNGERSGLEHEGSPVTLRAWTSWRRHAATEYGRVAYVERGAGPGALFLHGFPLNGFQWRDVMERLSPYRRCVAPDFLGLGFTEVAGEASVAPDAQLAMIVALLDKLSMPVVDVVANDSGGAVAQLLMVRHPTRVRTMLLTNCDVETDSPPQALMPVIEMAHAGVFPDRWLSPWLADRKLARSAEGLGGMTYTHSDNPTDDAIECYLGPLVSTPERKALTNRYAIALERNPLEGIEADLRRSKIPTRVVWGTGDPIFSQESPDYLDRVLGNSRGVRRVPGAKLFFPEEYPDLIAEEARALWNAKRSEGFRQKDLR